MEGGSPALIWQRWTLPMYAAQLRYWGDHPPLERIAAAYFEIKPRYTPPNRTNAHDRSKARAALHAPLTAAELAALAGGGAPIKADERLPGI